MPGRWRKAAPWAPATPFEPLTAKNERWRSVSPQGVTADVFQMNKFSSAPVPSPAVHFRSKVAPTPTRLLQVRATLTAATERRLFHSNVAPPPVLKWPPLVFGVYAWYEAGRRELLCQQTRAAIVRRSRVASLSEEGMQRQRQREREAHRGTASAASRRRVRGFDWEDARREAVEGGGMHDVEETRACRAHVARGE